MPSITALVAIALAGLVVLSGLGWACTGIAARNQREDPALRGWSAAVSLLGALVAIGIVVYVFVGTSIDADTDTYTGRQVLYLELSLTGSYLLAALFTLVGVRLIRQPSRPKASPSGGG